MGLFPMGNNDTSHLAEEARGMLERIQTQEPPKPAVKKGSWPPHPDPEIDRIWRAVIETSEGA